jgi:murein L,D-transpeptidase YcbB/YkuD
LNGQRHRAAPPPPPVAQPAARPVAQPVAKPAPVAVEPRNDAPAARAEAPRETEPSFARGALDRVFGVSDQQVSERLRSTVTSKQFDKQVDRAPERKAMESYYAARNYAPIWIKDGALTGRAKSVILRMKDAAADGLDPQDYPVPDLASLNTADAVAAADIKITDAMLDYARHLAVGRIAPTRVSAEVDYGNHTPDPDDILKRIAEGGGDAGAALENYNPPHAGFRALKQKLAELRSPRADAVSDPGIPEGPAIKPGAKDARVPLLRERLRVHGKAGDIVYDKALFNAIKNVQARADIKPTGVIDNKTLAAINGPKPAQQMQTVMANMERWRWLPRDLGRTYVMVNIPDFTLKVVKDNGIVWRTKIVAGKPQTPTPLLTAPMQEVIVNPSWYVPQSIIQNELLPQYEHDPHIFERMGLEVKRGPDGNINVVQPPGAANALGRIKFTFPNKFQVYLHDTPEKRLFAYDRRAFSHGCMRVEDPTKFGEVMLKVASNGPTPDSRQIYAMFGNDERKYQVQQKPLVHLTYQTAYVDDNGKLVIRDDLYGFDARIHAILHSDERRIADVAPPQDPKRDLATMKANQEILRRVERREAGNPFAFFERIFR